MSFQAKRRLLLGLLCAFLLWPFAHRSLVDRYLVNPWRLFGWAMYCVPDESGSVRFFGATARGMGELAYPDDPASHYLRNDYLTKHARVGRLVEPKLLAAHLLERYPLLERLVVEVSQPVYDPQHDRFRTVVDRYEYERLDVDP